MFSRLILGVGVGHVTVYTNFQGSMINIYAVLDALPYCRHYLVCQLRLVVNCILSLYHDFLSMEAQI